MSQSRPGLRVGDADREEALRALGDHLAAGRLDFAEFEGRSTRIASALTRADLLREFDDLPEPRPFTTTAQQVPAQRSAAGADHPVSTGLAAAQSALRPGPGGRTIATVGVIAAVLVVGITVAAVAHFAWLIAVPVVLAILCAVKGIGRNYRGYDHHHDHHHDGGCC